MTDRPVTTAPAMQAIAAQAGVTHISEPLEQELRRLVAKLARQVKEAA